MKKIISIIIMVCLISAFALAFDIGTSKNKVETFTKQVEIQNEDGTFSHYKDVSYTKTTTYSDGIYDNDLKTDEARKTRTDYSDLNAKLPANHFLIGNRIYTIVGTEIIKYSPNGEDKNGLGDECGRWEKTDFTSLDSNTLRYKNSIINILKI